MDRSAVIPGLAAVVALDRVGTIGSAGRLPWPRLPRDLARFRRLTLGHAVIMGRKTWDSLGGQPLPGRANLVLSRSGRPFPGADPFSWAAIRDHRRAWVIGGAEVFREFLPLCSVLHVTLIDGEFPGDARFPGGWPPVPDWVEAWRGAYHPPDEANPCGMRFHRFERRFPP
jgi:dihydrofolate reductase